jgi:hypothetical protein
MELWLKELLLDVIVVRQYGGKDEGRNPDDEEKDVNSAQKSSAVTATGQPAHALIDSNVTI